MRLLPWRRLPALIWITAGFFAVSVPSASAYPHFIGFESPTGNIGCVLAAEGVRCDVHHHSWPTPPTPRNCELDYGNGVNVGAHGRAAYVCAGDTALDAGAVLPYGKSERRGAFRCRSEEIGMRCVDLRDGHGFRVSRQRVRLF